MRKRNIRVQVWMNRNEKTKLQTNAKKSGMNQETYIRTLITGYVPREQPPVDYHSFIRELRAIRNNLNQIAVHAHTTGHLDKAVFQYEANRLRATVLDIQKAVTLPERRAE